MLESPSVENAERFMQAVDLPSRLKGGILTPMAGNQPVRFRSLREVADFLVVSEDPEAMLFQAPLSRVHYVDPASTARWVRDQIGDSELAAALAELVDSRKPYGFIVPEMKALISERIAQCDEILQTSCSEVG